MEDSEPNKLFVGGISWETTDDAMKEHFGQYGTVLDSVIAKDRFTGNPRGFAFLTFAESSSVDRALQDSHEILGRKVEVKRAIPRSEQQAQQQHNRELNRNNSRVNGRSNDQSREKKIFVGGLSANLTVEEFRSYFEKFGRIIDVVVMHDNKTQRPRGFGFITFDSEDSVEEVLQNNFYELTGKLVEVKRAIPKDGISNSTNVYNGNLSDGRVPNFHYQQGSYSPYNTRFGYFPTGFSLSGYPYGTGIYGNGYPSGGYGGINYGFAPVSPSGPWSPAMFGVGGGLLPYGSVAPVYPTYLNGGPGVAGLGAHGYTGGVLSNGFSVKSAQIGVRDVHDFPEPTPSRTGMNDAEANYFGSGRGTGVAPNKQSQKSNDKPYQVTSSN